MDFPAGARGEGMKKIKEIRLNDDKNTKGYRKMVWKQVVQEELNKIPANHSGEIKFTEGELRVGLRLADWDRLGCLLTQLELQPTSRSPLKVSPEKVEKKITYLGEEIKIIEQEGPQGKAILRSARPLREKENLSYFEVALDPKKGLSLVRYAYDCRQRERSAIPAPLTRHSLERLLADLIELASAN
jgi:hypothetical protein